MKIDKSKFKDSNGRYLVQGVFLEDRYDPEMATYTFAGEDKDYKGKIFPSLKRLYLEEGDPTEYLFATKYLYDWNHWKRMCNNAVCKKHIEEWRSELELSLMADGIQSIIQAATSDGHFQASKYLADRGWDVKGRGRPSKEELEGELKKRAEEAGKFEDDFQLLKLHKGGKK